MSARDDMLVERYGGARRGRRVALLVGLAPVVVAFLAWVVWAAWLHSTPQVDSELVGWDVVDEHSVTAEVEVQLDEGATARCLVQALADDHTPVGELSWVPEQGRHEVSIRTERLADAVNLVGCTTPDQKRPR
ncbi:MAG: DUF4307 domain-containing protein [Nocardioidaceae bacterium]